MAEQEQKPSQESKEQEQKPQERQKEPRCYICYMPPNKYGFCWDHDPQFRKKLYGPKWH